MNMIEKIQEIMDERGLTKADVSKGADIPYTTFDGLFKKGFENVRFPTLRKLAVYFDVSMEFLINDDETDKDFGKTIAIDLTNEEQHLIVLWRKLSQDEKMKMLGRIEAKVEELATEV
jgi:transcriptional regulator with XRE-family HTH domain